MQVGAMKTPLHLLLMCNTSADLTLGLLRVEIAILQYGDHQIKCMAKRGLE